MPPDSPSKQPPAPTHLLGFKPLQKNWLTNLGAVEHTEYIGTSCLRAIKDVFQVIALPPPLCHTMASTCPTKYA